jgi:cellulose synthase (UDP-forming)
MGLLIAGLVTGIRLWFAKIPLPGLEVSLFWGAVNLILVGVAILAAVELPEWRRAFRIKRRLPCLLVRGGERLNGIVKDINETGALIRINKQFLKGEGPIVCSVKNQAGDRLTVKGRLCRQEEVSSNAVEIGLKFIDVDEKTADSLIAATFSDSRAWNRPEVEPGIFQSLWSLLGVFRKVVKPSRKSHRSDLRLPYQENCVLVLPDRTLEGTVEEISTTGLSVNIPGTVDLVGENGTLYVESVALKVRRRWVTQYEGMVVAGFAIEQVEKGADQWRELLTSRAA